MLMKAGGETCKVTGLSISTVSTLYGMKYLTTAGCGLIEYLPFLFSANRSVSFFEHMNTKQNAQWSAVLATALFLFGGVLLRKTGTYLSDGTTITKVENFLYKRKSDESHVD